MLTLQEVHDANNLLLLNKLSNNSSRVQNLFIWNTPINRKGVNVVAEIKLNIRVVD